MPKRLKHI